MHHFDGLFNSIFDNFVDTAGLKIYSNYRTIVVEACRQLEPEPFQPYIGPFLNSSIRLRQSFRCCMKNIRNHGRSVLIPWEEESRRRFTCGVKPFSLLWSRLAGDRS